MISAISSARPKIADYPFTTLTPNLGVVKVDEDRSFVVADIPGSIEGAHEGAGLGIRFLRHVERTRLLVHLIDISALDPTNPTQAYHLVNRELSLYSSSLATKPQLVVLNKMDVTDAADLADSFCKALPDLEVLRVSAVTRHGLEKMIYHIYRRLEILDEQP